MAEQEKWTGFESYSQASKMWTEALDTWTKSAKGFPGAFGGASQSAPDMTKMWTDGLNAWTKASQGFPGSFGGASQSAWLEPFRKSAEEWGKIYGNMANSANAAPFPYSVMKEMGDATGKVMGSYVKVYDALFKSVDSLTREAYEIGQRVARGETPQTRPFFESIQNSYGTLSAALLETLKATKIDGSREMHEAMDNSADSLSEEQKMTAKLIDEMLHYNAEAASLSKSALERTTEAMAQMFEKGEISSENYQAILDALAETLKHSAEVLRLPVTVAPGYEGMIDEATQWSKANVRLNISWIEANLKLVQGLGKTPSEVYKAGSDAFKDAKASNPEDIYRKWGEVCNKAAELTAGNTQLKESMPKVINAYADWNRAANEFYKTLSTSPYPDRDELAKLSREIEKMKKTLEREKRPRTKTEGVKAEEVS